MALSCNCHRTIRTVRRSQNKDFLLRKSLPIHPATFGEQLRAARVAQGYNQIQVAHKFGVSLSSVKFWEQNRTHPKPSLRTFVRAFVNDAKLAIPPINPTGPSTAQNDSKDRPPAKRALVPWPELPDSHAPISTRRRPSRRR